jgi:hypothetical protein
VPSRARHSVSLDAESARWWLALAVGSLVIAGLLSLLLVVGRLPVLHELFTDPLFFRRALVVHVDLALGVWFYAFVAALFFAVPARGPSNPISRGAALFAAAGVVLLLIAAGVPGAEPVLANYVPVIDHPLYASGLILIAIGLGATFLDGRLLPRGEGERSWLSIPDAARVGLRAAALAVLLALVTFAAAAISTPADLPIDSRAELIVWGGGHVLQFASTAAMLAVWTILLTRATGVAPVSRATAAVLFGALVLPLLAAPLLAIRGTTDVAYHAGFTWLMRWAIFPVVLVYLVLCVRSVLRARRVGAVPRSPLSDWRVAAFATSAVMTLAGFLIGAMIRGSSTTVPAHYHASIGAVTAAFMAVAYPMVEALGMPVLRGRLGRAVRWQPVLFGAGQLVFAVGFGLAGVHGQARKAYATEQVIRSTAEWIGLGVMGVGGLIAVAGGVLFLVAVIRAWLARPARALEPGGAAWRPTSIQSRG